MADSLGELIERLEAEVFATPEKVLRHGFKRPHSYRGDYSELAFEPAENVRVADMLRDARAALGTTYQGYKGGDYTMNSWTPIHLAQHGCTGETLGTVLLNYMLSDAQPGSVVDSVTCHECGEGDGDGDVWFHEECTGMKSASAQVTSLNAELVAQRELWRRSDGRRKKALAELEQCRQQLAAAQADVDLHWTNLGLAAEANERLTAQLAAAQEEIAVLKAMVANDPGVQRDIDAARLAHETGDVVSLAELEARLDATQDVPGLVRNDVELRAEIKRLNAVIREYATNLARLDAAQQEPATASKKSERCDCPECQQGFALGVEPAPPHKPTERCVDTCDNPMVCRDLYGAWLDQQEPATTGCLWPGHDDVGGCAACGHMELSNVPMEPATSAEESA